MNGDKSLVSDEIESTKINSEVALNSSIYQLPTINFL